MEAEVGKAVGILLIQGNSTLRKSLRKELERDGFAVMAVSSIGEAVARLRTMRYELVLCTDKQRSVSWSDDYELLIDTRGLLARSGGRYELYLPGIGVSASAVLIMPTVDPQPVRTAVTDTLARLERMRGGTEGALAS